MWAVISGFFGRIFGLQIVKTVLLWLAVKAFFLGLLFVAYPVVHHSLVLWGMQFSGDIIKAVFAGLDMGDDMQTIVLNLTGVGGYLANCFQLPSCFSIIMSAYMVRMSMLVLSFVPRP